MEVLENQQLREFVSMRIGGPARYITRVRSEQDVLDAAAFAEAHNLKMLALGSGTNVVFSDSGFDGLILINEISGIAFDDCGKIRIGAGEQWDSIVEKTVAAGFIGIEAMSLIPGTTGATPINNVGAYGQEISDTLVQVRAYDTQTREFVEIPNEECAFTYRSSRFKAQDYGRFIITSITLQLLPYVPSEYEPPTYPALQKALQEFDSEILGPSDVRSAVIAVRSSKLPDPAKVANVGSFFKNPIVPENVAHNLQLTYPDMPAHGFGENSKLSAGWLIEHAGLKGLRKFGIFVSDKQALVLINESATSYLELENMVTYITDAVQSKFGIALEPEPELL